MEGGRHRRSRQLKRCHEISRVEDELWALAYSQIAAFAPRGPKHPPPVHRGIEQVPVTDRFPVARSA